MRRRLRRDLGILLWAGLVWMLLGSAVPSAQAQQKTAAAVDFATQIRPLLSDRCFKCHGPDSNAREAELRLDIRKGVFEPREDGQAVVVPGKPEQSLLYQRIITEDEDLRMPPEGGGKPLSKAEADLIRRWIEQGAPWEDHWAFVPPKRPPLPQVKNRQGVRNPIDLFIRARLEQEGLQPAPEASRETLIRRLSLDLTGLPPTLEEVDRFLADRRPGAYERLVDRLLASPHYGEHMARYWLDAARYGDTHGLHLDNYRSIWPYRDWVIRAFNANMPFDQFTIEQIAGDLLPNATREQRIATGFLRCNVTTSEGGVIEEEFRVRYTVDRTETVGTVFLGMTIGCAVCHEHKYDPISQREFYQLYAFFNSAADRGLDGNAPLPPPTMKIPSPEQEAKLAELRKQLKKAQQAYEQALAGLDYKDPLQDASAEELTGVDEVWIDEQLPAGANPQGNEGAKSWQWVSQPEHPVHSGQKATVRKAKELSQHFFLGANPPLVIREGDVLFAYVYLDPKDKPDQIMLQFHSGNWEHRAYWGKNRIQWGRDKSPSRRPMGPLPPAGKWVRLEVPAEAVGLKPGAKVDGWAFTQFGGTVYWDHAGVRRAYPSHQGGFLSFRRWLAVTERTRGAGLPKELKKIIDTPAEKRTKQQLARLRRHFLQEVCVTTRKQLQPLRKERERLQQEIKKLEDSIPATLVMADLPKPRETYVLLRGEYDRPDKNQKVQPDVPAVFPPLPEGAPRNRLGLAQWLVRPDHPLTARVTVNRLWQQFFGVGLVKTAEDFGSQGEVPSHPELLDWLAVEFVESGWDVKHIVRLIVTSATYRQSSVATPELIQRDPENRLLARGPRFRLDGEVLRDQALAVSGLLVRKLGGPGVKPYQPPGIWEAVAYPSSNTAKYKQDHGEKLYRRSIYLFWKRTAPPPNMVAFDAPTREKCTVRRPRTNTPLQALVTLNDPTFVEAARALAQRVLKETSGTLDDRLVWAFRTVTSRRPKPRELEVLRRTYQDHLDHYRRNPEQAKKLLQVGESPRDESLDVAEHAAWTMIGNLLLNLSETLTKG